MTMCLIFFSYNIHPEYRLIVAANRDEFYTRPAKALDFWEDEPEILAGRDLTGMGTWMGITRSNRFAAVTNFRDPRSQKPDAPSRGLLISRFLSTNVSPEQYLEDLQASAHEYNGFNLLTGDASSLFYYSNKSSGIRQINPGFYGLSNHLLDTPWHKVEKGKAALKSLFAEKEIDVEAVFGILGDRQYPADDLLPDTGVGLIWERILSPVFVSSESYGTRSSSVLLLHRTGEISFTERTFTGFASVRDYLTDENLHPAQTVFRKAYPKMPLNPASGCLQPCFSFGNSPSDSLSLPGSLLK